MSQSSLAAVVLAMAMYVTGYGDEKPTAAWPTEFDKFAGRHQTLANRVLAFEARAVGSTTSATAILDDLLDDASTLRLDVGPSSTRQQIVEVLLSIDTLLLDNGFVFPPCRLVETLSDSLTPRAAHSQNRAQLLEKNRRKRHVIRDRQRVLHYSDCDTTSLLYLSIAELHGFALRLVDLPTHTFLRYHFSDGTYLNWDPLDAAEVTDGEYVYRYDVLSRDVASRRYLRPFTVNELAGYLLLLRGKQFAIRGMWLEAEYDYRRSIALYTQSPQARYELAHLYFTFTRLRQTRIDDAIALAREAVDTEPRNANYLNCLACLLALTGEFSEASKLEDAAAEMEDDSQVAGIYSYRACAFAQQQLDFQPPSAERINAAAPVSRRAQCVW